MSPLKQKELVFLLFMEALHLVFAINLTSNVVLLYVSNMYISPMAASINAAVAIREIANASERLAVNLILFGGKQNY